ncbi:SusD/RagB family nutrient-binding outer membrane lipoprotein [soil metagenome]
MKKITTYTILFLSMLCLLPSCEDGFDEINTNKTQPIALDPAFLMNNAIITTSIPVETMVFELPIVQQIITPFGGVLGGGNYNQDNKGRNAGNWVRYYQVVLKSLISVINTTKTDANRTNLYHSARIMRAYASMVLTDSYGDVPYFQVGSAFIDNTTLPVYDSQESIYKDVLKELEEASAALDATKAINTSDVLFGGNIPQWKAFGYSLMLRAAMRLTKSDQATAQQFVAKAVTGGVIQLNSGNAVVRHTTLYQNGVSVALNGSEANNYFLAKPFTDYLFNKSDPRLRSISVRYVGAASGPQQTAAIANTTPSLQRGMPMGFDNGTIVAKATLDGLASFYDYSQLDRTRMGKLDAPFFLVSNAETKLLLAEARVRNWITTGSTAAVLYSEGIRAHMADMATYSAASAILITDIDAFILANPLTVGFELRDINEQYWVASFLNAPETFANLRRSGFPVLPTNPYPGKVVADVRKLTYPDSEYGINPTNLNAAVARQGGDKIDTRVWWDKP